MTKKISMVVPGAMKSGTTAFFYALCKHPGVEGPNKQSPWANAYGELQYYSRFYTKGKAWYLNHYSDDGRLKADNSNDYFHYPFVPERLVYDFPEVKIIFLLRDPVSRTISHFKHNKMKPKNHPLYERLSLLDAINRETGFVKNDIHSMRYLIWTYSEISKYIKHVRRWFNVFPRENMIFVEFDEMIKHTKTIFNRVFDFLDLPSFDVDLLQNPNQSEVDITIDETEIRYLKELYKPYNEALFHLIGTSYHW